jgi:PIN domain nuclease of toxin-antitoxin system
MRLLLDTHIVIWFLDTPNRISPRAMPSLLDTDNRLFISTASLLEIAAKVATGRLVFDDESRRRTEQLGDWLQVTADHAWRVRTLPPIHKDPFDRVIVAQAMLEDMTLVTADSILGRYGVPILLA